MRGFFSALLVALFVFGALPAGHASSFKVGMAYDSCGKGDGSFNDAAHAGVIKAQRELGIEVLELTAAPNETEAARQDRLRQLVSAGCNPVIAVGGPYRDPLAVVAQEFPSRAFALIDDEISASNAASIIFSAEQGSYLVGVIAASASTSGHIGFVGGMDIPLIHAFEAGFRQGATSVRPDIRIAVRYLGDGSDASVWNKPDAAASMTRSMLDEHVDVIYAAAGASNLGVFQSIHAAGGPSQGLWAIGVDSDQYAQPMLAAVKEVILTSMLKRIDVAVFEVITAVTAGKPIVGLQRYDLARHGVGYAVSNPAVEPYRAKADEAARRIIAGELTVSPTRVP